MSVLARWQHLGRNIKKYRFFIHQLIRISILIDYRKSFIGLTWLVIVPLASILIWLILQNGGILNTGEPGIPYPAYVLLSTSLWGFFAEMYKSSSLLISSHGQMMIMTNFPHEVLIVKTVIVHLIRFAIPFGINLLVLIAFDVKFSWVAFFFPLTLIPLLVLGLGIGLLVALLRIVMVDLSNMIDQSINLLMFLTPIVYAPKIDVGWLSIITHYNPLTYLIGFSRDVLTMGEVSHAGTYIFCALGTMGFFLVSMTIFMNSERRIIERLINI